MASRRVYAQCYGIGVSDTCLTLQSRRNKFSSPTNRGVDDAFATKMLDDLDSRRKSPCSRRRHRERVGSDAKRDPIACRQVRREIQDEVAAFAVIQSHRHCVRSAFDQDAGQKIHLRLAKEPGDELVASVSRKVRAARRSVRSRHD